MVRWLTALTGVGLLIAGAGIAPAIASDPLVDGRAPLFAASTTLDVELQTDLRTLRSGKRESGFQPGVLSWRDGDANGEVAVGVKPRGRFRLDRTNCQFPPLFLRFPADAEGPFAGQDIVPLTTHCQPSHVRYVIQEYLAYRTFTVLTNQSVGARLARIRYVDSAGRGKPIASLSFFLEHFDALAARVGGEFVDDDGLAPDATQGPATALVNVFQYLIGNTDWSILAQHNIALFRTAEGAIMPVPYDFDFAGVVDARYAVPSDKLPIRSVRQRLYRGFCQSEEIVLGAIAHVASRRTTIEALYRGTPELSESLAERSLAYYGEFFAQAASAEEVEQQILAACRRSNSS